MKRMMSTWMVVVTAAIFQLTATAVAGIRLTPLSSQRAQHRPKAPAHRSPKYTCVPGSLGDQLCCVWHVTYPGYGFGTWTDCVVVPAVKP